MLARRESFEHPTVGTIELPLLVPAFSSKGFEIRHKGKGKHRKPYSEVAYQLEEFGKHPHKAVLLSAYDIHFGHFKAPELSPQAPLVYLKNVNVAFIDSGGYELAPEYDSTEPRRFSREAERFTIADYHAVLDRLDGKGVPVPLVIANYDHRRERTSLEQQVREARATFTRYRNFANDFILKPWQGRYVDPADMSDSDIANLRGFDIIGVTEKELGRDLIDKLKRIALLRQKLDAQNLRAPIHVWGGLEPLSSPLFFFAGAQIVDGVSWLRYAYRNGLAIVRDTYCIVSNIGIAAPNQMNHLYASLNNLVTLENMTVALQQWVDLDGKDFSMFPTDVRRPLAEAYQVMRARIPALRVERTSARVRRRTEGG
jgi:hypothetical protein